MATRTVREFSSDRNIWPAAGDWAQRWGYSGGKSDETTQLYVRNHGFLGPQSKVQISQSEGNVRIEGWLEANMLKQIQYLMLLPAEAGMESSAFFGAVPPRRDARRAFNNLLSALGEEPVP